MCNIYNYTSDNLLQSLSCHYHRSLGSYTDWYTISLQFLWPEVENFIAPHIQEHDRFRHKEVQDHGHTVATGCLERNENDHIAFSVTT